MAAAGAGVARRLPGRGGCNRFRRDRFQRAHAHPGAVPGGTDFLSGGIHDRRTGLPGRICLGDCLLICRPERVLVGEHSIVIVAGHISVGERVFIRIRACLPVAVRVPEPPFVRLSVPDLGLGLAYIRVPDADADHIGTGFAEHTRVFSTRIFSTACTVGGCNFGTGRIHAGEYRRASEHSTGGVRFYVAAVDEKGQYAALGTRRHSPSSC